ncbi:MAG: hydrogenase, partial [Opitutales bacterium]|nr:hydrogenase [Opitutales bacterium]
DAEDALSVIRSRPFLGSFPSLTPDHPQAHLFERLIFEEHGLTPAGHPWLKPVRKTETNAPRNSPFFEVAGSEIHEVAVGPVHAGIIEPGHFRFQCTGEKVHHLEIALGYQHRGIEAALTGGPFPSGIKQIEALAGDTSIAHTTAYATNLEVLAGTEAPLQAQWIRAIALELERLANHTGDIGALANDVAFIPTSSACGRIRGDFLNLTAMICGNRFGRSLVTPGGCQFDLEPERACRLRERLLVSLSEVEQAARWLWESSSSRARFERIGTITPEDAATMGMVGPAVRACGLVRDVRFDHPAGWHRFAQIPVSVWPDGDVQARARVRWLEIRQSGEFLKEQLAAAPNGPLTTSMPPLMPDTLAVTLVEGWRGEVCHVAITDYRGRLKTCKVTDPSFHNWTGLALAMRNQAISDFPICNKSFNLSYCGFDL